MSAPHVHILDFDTETALQDAFREVSDHLAVESCSVEWRERRIRFMADPKLTDDLIERLYLGGGLKWCTRLPEVQTPEVTVDLSHSVAPRPG